MAINSFTPDVQEKIGYYVYRLIDPRDYSTFYVGKGKGNRVFEHAKAAIKFSKNSDEDEASAKIQQIRDIMASGKDVITIIQRHGLDEGQAFEVEAALIDAFPGLTNIQGGHGSERGVISTEDLQNTLGAVEYVEPANVDYVIIKTSEKNINTNGSLYEATRRAWKASLENARKYKYALSVIYGIVREVYEVDKWIRSTEVEDRVEFIGHTAPDNIRTLFIGKMIPAKYRAKGLASPFLYKK